MPQGPMSTAEAHAYGIVVQAAHVAEEPGPEVPELHPAVAKTLEKMLDELLARRTDPAERMRQALKSFGKKMREEPTAGDDEPEPAATLEDAIVMGRASLFEAVIDGDLYTNPDSCAAVRDTAIVVEILHRLPAGPVDHETELVAELTGLQADHRDLRDAAMDVCDAARDLGGDTFTGARLETFRKALEALAEEVGE